MKLVILDDSHVKRDAQPLALAALESKAFRNGVFPLDGTELPDDPKLTAAEFTRRVIEPLLDNGKGDGECVLVLDLNVRRSEWFGRDVLRTLDDDDKLPFFTILMSANITEDIRAEVERLNGDIEMRNRLTTTPDKILELISERRRDPIHHPNQN